MLVLLLAGHDTTAYSLAWILKELAKNPQEQANLRSELLQTSVEERHNLKALQNVIKEGLRLNPVAALGGIRTSSKDIVIEATGKYPRTVIPKGSMIFFSLMSVHRNTLYFENPDDFIPSRWENPSDDAVTAYLPFLTGPRNCVGQSLAYAEIRTVLSLLCSNYDFKIENEGTNTFFLTYKPRNCLLTAKRIHA
jgi:cytochrome P450